MNQPERPRGIGFVGLSTQGWAASALVQPLFHPLLASKYTLVALCTRSASSASAAASLYRPSSPGNPVTAYHGPEGIDALIADRKVEIVAVSVKIPDHFAIVEKAIERGKDVFVEWTPGCGFEETRRMEGMARRKGVRIMVGAQGGQAAAVRKVKEIIEAGKIGRVLSTSVLLTSSDEMLLWGTKTRESSRYILDINNETTILSVHTGHFLAMLEPVLGSFTSLTAHSAIRYPTAHLTDNAGTPTGETVSVSAPDQVALVGTLSSGVFASIHMRAGIPCSGERGAGRRMFQWVIDGEEGSIEVVNRPEDGEMGAFFTLSGKDVYLNGEKVELRETEVEGLGMVGKAWWEFARGEEGRYTTMQDAVRIHRVLDAAKRSIEEGRRVAL